LGLTGQSFLHFAYTEDAVEEFFPFVYNPRMPNILYTAISQDGFIAGVDDETPWSDAEWEAFKTFVTSCDAVLLGRRTFQIMQEDELVDGPRYIVVTNNKDFVVMGWRN
jgi:dihydrofolate reductase